MTSAGRAMVPLALRGGGVGGGSPGGRRSRRGDEPLRPGARASALAGVWARCAQHPRVAGFGPGARTSAHRPHLPAGTAPGFALPAASRPGKLPPPRRPRGAGPVGGFPGLLRAPGPRRTSAPRQVGRFRRYSRKRSSGLAQDAAARAPSSRSSPGVPSVSSSSPGSFEPPTALAGGTQVGGLAVRPEAKRGRTSGVPEGRGRRPPASRGLLRCPGGGGASGLRGVARPPVGSRGAHAEGTGRSTGCL